MCRKVTDEEVYLKACVNSFEARRGLGDNFRCYNILKLHQALGYRTPPGCSAQLEDSEMADTCHGCKEELLASGMILGVFAGRKPSYGSLAVVWTELYDPQLLLAFHPECMRKLWEQSMDETLPSGS